MNEMIERVARAIGVPEQNGLVCPWSLKAARAAIEAMRQPTQEMSNAGTRIGCDYDSGVSDIEAECIWEDMIGAALHEKVDA